MANSKAIIIAHRLSTVRSTVRIIVLSNGDIIEDGSHDTLMQQFGHYAELYNTLLAVAGFRPSHSFFGLRPLSATQTNSIGKGNFLREMATTRQFPRLYLKGLGEDRCSLRITTGHDVVIPNAVFGVRNPARLKNDRDFSEDLEMTAYPTKFLNTM